MLSSGSRSWWFKPGQSPFAALDIGHHKVVCLIAQQIRGGELLVLGRGITRSLGVERGIVDRMAVSEAIAAAVSEAIARVGGGRTVSLRNIHVAGPLHSTTCTENLASLEIGGEAVTPGHVYRALAKATPPHDPYPDERVHSIAQDFAINDLWGVSDPTGYRADDLKVRVQLVSANRSEILNLTSVVRDCDLTPKSLTAQPLASAHACLTEEDRKLGVLFLDLGAGTTHVAAYTEGLCRYLGGIPLGGQHLTDNLARTLNMSLEEAERTKTLRGDLRSSANNRNNGRAARKAAARKHADGTDAPLFNLMAGNGLATEQQQLEFPQEGAESLRSSMDTIISTIKTELRDVPNIAGVSRVAVTGGGSQLQGMVSYLEQCFHLPVRLCGPRGVRGGTRAGDYKFDPTSNPDDSACVGLLKLVTHPLPEYEVGLSQEIVSPTWDWLQAFGLARPTPQVGETK